MKEPQDMTGFKWALSRIQSGEVTSVYTDGKRIYHGGQRRPEQDCCHVGTYIERRGYRTKFDLFQFIADIEAACAELELQSAALGMGR